MHLLLKRVLGALTRQHAFPGRLIHMLQTQLQSAAFVAEVSHVRKGTDASKNTDV
jgi:hypothetical protein